MDNIGTRLVKLVFPVICYPLLHIYNLSLSTGVVPKKLQIAKVIPVYKKGDADSTCNYRPISLLSIFDKLLRDYHCISMPIKYFVNFSLDLEETTQCPWLQLM